MAQKPRRGESLPQPPTPPEGGPDDLDYVYRTPGELQSVQPYYGLPLMTPEMRRYRVGGRQMTDPRQFEYMQRKREEARTQGTRLKKGGPVKKYQKGGMIEEAKDKAPSMRQNLEKETARIRQRLADMDMYPEREVDRDQTPFRPRMPSLTGRGDRSIRQQMDDERARREMEFEGRVQRRRQDLGSRLSGMEGELADMGSKENKAAYKKGGKVSGKNFIQGAIKKPGALRAQMGVKAGQKIPAKKLAAAAKAPGKLGQRARFAQTLAKMKRK